MHVLARGHMIIAGHNMRTHTRRCDCDVRDCDAATVRGWTRVVSAPTS